MNNGDYILPGMPNLHSHAFQRAMAGQAEQAAKGKNDFWSWRKKMYDYAKRVTPEQLHAITAQLFMEMLKSGYTSVAEFHYLHHTGQRRPGAAVDGNGGCGYRCGRGDRHRFDSAAGTIHDG